MLIRENLWPFFESAPMLCFLMSPTPNTSLRTEAVAGITTFFTMSYIIVVNPTILSTPGTSMASTFGAGVAGTSSGTAYIESIAGINSGGRTGLTSVFTALCFLPCFFLAPLAGMVPIYATAPVLVLVGASMFKSVNQIDFRKIEEGLPAFLTIILIPLTFSITQGILWGFISHVGLYLVVGRRKEIHPVMFVLASIAIGLLLLEHSDLARAFYE